MAATFSKGVYIPEFAYFVFQLTFAAITPCLIVGAFAERLKFSAVLLFLVIWFTFAYVPIAHMVWFWAGPDAYTDAEAGAAAGATAGFIFQKGALDFAGGTVVHINAGIAGLVGALFAGKRVGYGKAPMPPHNLPFVMIGASLLWVGWFGFNVGSNLEATGLAAQVFANTMLATAAAALAWSFAEWIWRGTPTMLGAASGAIAGLVAITPACGWVGPMGSIVIGLVAGLVLPARRHQAQGRARLRRLAGRVRRALHRRHPRRPADRRVLRPGAGRHRRVRLRGQRGRGVLDCQPSSSASSGASASRSSGPASSRWWATPSSTRRSACGSPRTRSARASTPRPTARAPIPESIALGYGAADQQREPAVRRSCPPQREPTYRRR